MITEALFINVFFLGMAIAFAGQVLMVVYRKPGVSSMQVLLTGTPEEPYPLFLKPRLKMVRADKVHLVYVLMFIGVAITMVDILALATFAIARSMGIF